MKKFYTIALCLSVLIIPVKPALQSIYVEQKNEEIERPQVSKVKINERSIYQMYQKGRNKKNTPVYFFFGVTGSGVSSSIFALQGNEVSKISEEDDDEDEEDDDGAESFEVQFRKTLQIASPRIGEDSASSETSASTIYHHPNKNIAFCDNIGFASNVRHRQDGKYISSFAPYFCLKVNSIGGIVFVMSSFDMEDSQYFTEMANFLHKYFGKNSTTALKKSVVLLLTKCDTKFKKGKKLRTRIKEAYKSFYSTSDQGGDNLLKPFFDIFLQQEVEESNVSKLKNFVLSENVIFFDPTDKDCIQKTIKIIENMQPISHEFLCKRSDKNAHILNENVREIGARISKAASDIMPLKNEVGLIKYHLGEGKINKGIKELMQKIEKDLKKKQKRIQILREDTRLEVLASKKDTRSLNQYEGSHHFDGFGKGFTEEYMEPCKNAINSDNFIKQVAGVAGLAFSPISCICYYVRFLADTGYLTLDGSMPIQEPIAKISVKYKVTANFSFGFPKKNFLERWFHIQKNEISGQFVWTMTAKNKSVRLKKPWTFSHSTHYASSPDFSIIFYGRSNELFSTEKKIRLIDDEIRSGHVLLKGGDTVALKKMYQKSNRKLKEALDELLKGKGMIDMLKDWNKRLLNEPSFKQAIELFDQVTNTQYDQSDVPDCKEEEKQEDFIMYSTPQGGNEQNTLNSNYFSQNSDQLSLLQ